MARAARAIAGAVLAALAGCLGPATNHCGNGFTCPAGLRCEFANDRAWCVPPNCGNGVVDVGEACDDGNNTSGDGCPADCSPACGDGFVDPGEVCDDGAHQGEFGYTCGADCRSAPPMARCGDGHIQAGEACDDGDLRNHDGCSSACTLEQLAWTPITTGTPAAGPGVMAYDPPHGVIVLLDAALRTWEWTGDGWQRRHTSAVPAVSAGGAMVFDRRIRSSLTLFADLSRPWPLLWAWDGIDWGGYLLDGLHAMFTSFGVAYDAAREITVLVGHSAVTGEEETWEEAALWQQRPVRLGRSGMPAASSPSHAMTYDPKRSLVLLYRADGLWAYDGRDWNLLGNSAGPVSDDLQLVYDAARDRIVLFGLVGSAVETWEWDGSAWQRKAMTGPPPRKQAAMAYDVVHATVVLFGGRDAVASSGLDDTWLWDGTAWRRAMPAVPPARSHHAAVYEDGRATTLMFGGIDASGRRLGDTWIWDGAAWRQPALGVSPPPRADHAMAYDSATNRTLLFGGTDGAGHSLGDTWEWDGTAWHDRSDAPGPPPRSRHAMAADPLHGGVILIGGSDGGAPLADQWVWAGRWTEVTPAGSPAPRRDTALVYNPNSLRVELFGGEGPAGLFGDVWQWSGSEWAERGLGEFHPEPRAGHRVLYDPLHREVMMFGGHDALGARNDAWTWKTNEDEWRELVTAVSPPARDHFAMVYDRANDRPLVFGGEDASAAPLGDLWTVRYEDPGRRDEACTTGLDGDRDGKAGCDDPDCEGLCASCGNGVCEPFESSRICPRDCGVASVCGDWLCDAGENCASCPGDCRRCIGAIPGE